MINYFYSKNKIKKFEAKLVFVSEKINLKKWISINTAIGFALFCLISIIIFIYELQTELIIFVFFSAFFAVFTFSYFLFEYLYEKKKKELEDFIPDMLLTASIFSAHNTIEEVISFIAREDYGLLSKEFFKAEQEIKKGASITEALNQINERINSNILKRTINLMNWGYKSGINTSELFKEAAEDLLETKTILSERNSTTLIEKYTLLIAGGILVPLILGLIVKMVLELNIPVIEGLEIGLSAEKRKALLEAALQSNQVYIIEFSLISSYFIALIEGNQKKTILYCIILIPLSLIVYTAVQFL
jgi:Flp pilus assembly protein TadB